MGARELHPHASELGRKGDDVTTAALVQAGFDADVVLRDGSTAHVRPASAADRPLLRQLYERLSPESR